MNSLSECVTVHTLETIKLRFSAVVPDEILHSFRVKATDLAEYASEGLLLELEGFMYGDRASHTLCVSVPATWWQHFKESCFPAWLLARFPVRHRQLRQTVHAARLFPQVRPKKLGDPIVQILEVEGRKWLTP